MGSTQPSPTVLNKAATLYCSWGLSEYKHAEELAPNNEKRCSCFRESGVALMRHAVALDPSKAPVLRWKRFQNM